MLQEDSIPFGALLCSVWEVREREGGKISWEGDSEHVCLLHRFESVRYHSLWYLLYSVLLSDLSPSCIRWILTHLHHLQNCNWATNNIGHQINCFFSVCCHRIADHMQLCLFDADLYRIHRRHWLRRDLQKSFSMSADGLRSKSERRCWFRGKCRSRFHL